MSSRWPLARNCHVVLSDLQQTVRLSGNAIPHSPSHGPRSSFQATGRDGPVAIGGHTSDQSRGSKRRRIDTDGRQDDTTRQADQTSFPRPGEAAALNHAIDDPASRPAPVVPSDGQPAHDLNIKQPRLQQQQRQVSLPPQDPPIAATPDARASDAVGFSAPGFGSDESAWMGGPAVGNWDGGMPDILGGITWESLLNVVDQDNLAWRGGFL